MSETTVKPAAKRKKRKLSRRIKDGLYRMAGPRLLGGLFSLLARSLKLKFEGFDTFMEQVNSGRPVLITFWHEDILSIFLLHLRYRLGKIGVMLSQSRDGEKLCQIINRYELTPIRASSSHGAVRGFLEMYRWLKKPKDHLPVATIAIDGPLGPRRVAKAGGAMLARKTGAVVLPMVFNHSRMWVFKSWDKTLLPKPFATSYVYIGEPLEVDGWGDDDEANARMLTDVLNRLKEHAGMP